MVKREDYIREDMEFYLKRWIELSLDDTMKHWLDQYRASQGLWRTEDLRRKAQIDDLTSQLDKLSDNALAGKLHELGWIKDLTAQKSDRQRRNLLLRKEAGKLVQKKADEDSKNMKDLEECVKRKFEDARNQKKAVIEQKKTARLTPDLELLGGSTPPQPKDGQLALPAPPQPKGGPAVPAVAPPLPAPDEGDSRQGPEQEEEAFAQDPDVLLLDAIFADLLSVVDSSVVDSS